MPNELATSIRNTLPELRVSRITLLNSPLMAKPTRPAFMATTSTGGYIGRWYWTNTGVHPDFPHWGSVSIIPRPALPDDNWGVWAGLFPVISQIINWRFYDSDY